MAERKQAREDSGGSCEFRRWFQSYLVHFANDALTEVEITARHGRVWIRSTESARIRNFAR